MRSKSLKTFFKQLARVTGVKINKEASKIFKPTQPSVCFFDLETNELFGFGLHSEVFDIEIWLKQQLFFSFFKAVIETSF